MKFPVSLHTLSHITFGVLAFLSIYFVTERLCYVDSAWQFWDRVNFEHFVFPSNRYGVFISEIPLFVAVKLGLPLKALVYIFSVGYIALYYLVWRICVYSLKSETAGLTLLLGLCIGVRQSFCHTVTETHQCLVYCALLFAVLDSSVICKEIYRWVLALTISVLALATHPVAVFPILFLTGFYLVKNNKLFSPLAYSVVALTVGIAFIRFLFPENEYDASQYGPLKNLSDLSFNLKEYYSLAYLVRRFRFNYWVVLAVALVTIILVWKEKIPLKGCFSALGVLGYFVLSIIAFRRGDSDLMMEKNFLPGIFMVNLVFADQFIRCNFQNDFRKMGAFSFILISGIVVIIYGCLYFQKRNIYLLSLIDKAASKNISKAIFTSSTCNPNKLEIPWAIGCESLLLSQFTYGECWTIVLKSPDMTIDENGLCFIPVKWCCFAKKNLNPKYFPVPQVPYKVITNN